MIFLRATRAAAIAQASQQSRFIFPPTPPSVLRFNPRLSSTMASSQVPSRRLQNSAVFVCDLQDKFRKAIWQFDKVLLTSQKVLRAAQIFKIPVFVTTQNAPKLGGIVPELEALTKDAEVQIDKTRFSMMTPEIASHPVLSSKREIVLIGIESHICITQTTLDLLAQGHKVYILADGVSSCNEQEVSIALARLRAEGAVITTSESWLYELMGDAGISEFRDVARLVKETSTDTKTALSGLLSKM
ncbi:Isochorismatase hydrolase [Xylaria nigripes]|nr:Isochorismatase hydrolase [Xylaria nigripes]